MKGRSLSKVLAITMVFVLTIAFAAFPVSAATTYTPIGGSTNITKNLVVENDANIPDIVFNYTITRGEAKAATASTIEILASDVTASIGTASFSNADTSSAQQGTPTDSTDTTKKYAQKEVAVTFPDGSFTKPGVYRYIIHESNGGKPGVTYDATARYLDVYVTANNNNELEVSSYVLRSTESSINTNLTYAISEAKSVGYTNTVTQYDFTFSKAIAGNQGDKNKRFTFTLSISNAIPGTYPVTATDVTGNPVSITVGTDGTYTGNFDLTNNSSLVVLNLNENAVCTVSEDSQDYAATYSLDGETANSGSSSGQVTMNNSHTVAFTNTRTGTIPTGILLTVGPFAVGLLVFGALAIFFFSRRKRSSY